MVHLMFIEMVVQNLQIRMIGIGFRKNKAYGVQRNQYEDIDIGKDINYRLMVQSRF